MSGFIITGGDRVTRTRFDRWARLQALLYARWDEGQYNRITATIYRRYRVLVESEWRALRRASERRARRDAWMGDGCGCTSVVVAEQN